MMGTDLGDFPAPPLLCACVRAAWGAGVGGGASPEACEARGGGRGASAILQGGTVTAGAVPMMGVGTCTGSGVAWAVSVASGWEGAPGAFSLGLIAGETCLHEEGTPLGQGRAQLHSPA